MVWQNDINFALGLVFSHRMHLIFETKDSLLYMFENLSEKLERSFKVLRGQGKISEINVAETMKEVRRALVDADVNYKVAKDFTNRVKNEASVEM